jgi:APA family basic amino acid/polyamine antiporter
MVPLFPIIGSALCIYLMTKLEAVTWLRFFGWLAAGLILYFVYGRTHSKLQQGDVRWSSNSLRPAWSSKLVEHRVH